MPGPGPHLIYTLGTGSALMSLSNGRFTPHHCVVYATNAFLGPDLGSFSEWLTSTLGIGENFGSSMMGFIHHPLYYILILGFPLSLFYAWLSRVAAQSNFLETFSGMALSRRQCILLFSAGSLSHFFLDHLFEILSTGWWKGRAPVNPDAVIVVGFLCTCLLGAFIYIHRVKPGKSVRSGGSQLIKLIAAIIFFYCLWCVSQIYLRDPPQPQLEKRQI
ncbi:hypothetical protein AMTRI_Chr10g231060 [Amborella trichopoda]